jgi:hypothetical protein
VPLTDLNLLKKLSCAVRTGLQPQENPGGHPSLRGDLLCELVIANLFSLFPLSLADLRQQHTKQHAFVAL